MMNIILPRFKLTRAFVARLIGLGVVGVFAIGSILLQSNAGSAANSDLITPNLVVSPSREVGDAVPPTKQAVTGPRRNQSVRASDQAPTAASKQTTAKETAKQPVIVSFILAPGVARAADGTKTLDIPRNVRLIKLQLSIDATENYKSFGASLQRVPGGEVWNSVIDNGRRARNGNSRVSATLSPPANVLVEAEYLLTLTGVTTDGRSEIVGDYFFRVTKKN